jgi:transcription termination factor Rho
MKIADLQSKKLPELKEIARTMGLGGYSHLRKQDLIYLILETRAESVAGVGNGAPRKAPDRGRQQEGNEASSPRKEVAEGVAAEGAGDSRAAQGQSQGGSSRGQEPQSSTSRSKSGERGRSGGSAKQAERASSSSRGGDSSSSRGGDSSSSRGGDSS